MTDKVTSGQIVPKLTEGLFLMDGIKGLLSLPRHSVDMLLTDPPYGTTKTIGMCLCRWMRCGRRCAGQ